MVIHNDVYNNDNEYHISRATHWLGRTSNVKGSYWYNLNYVTELSRSIIDVNTRQEFGVVGLRLFY